MAVPSKLQSLENWREPYRPTRRDFERQNQNRRVLRDPPIDGLGNRGPNSSVQVRHVRHGGRDRNPRGDSVRYSQTTQGRRNFFGGQGRPNDGTDSQLNAAAQDFMPCGNQRRDGSRSLTNRNGRDESGNLNA